MITCYFTATGNSLYAARRIGGELRSIPQLMKQERIELADDAVGIVCPVYCGEMPGMVRRFLEKAEIRTDYFFFVYTYGMSESVAKNHAADAVQKAGLTLSYINTVEMVYNYLPGFDMKDQIRKGGKKKIDERLERICGDIGRRVEKTVRVGAFRKAGMSFLHSVGERIMIPEAAQSFIVTRSCDHCGVCAKVCPAENIIVEDRVRFEDHCEVCFACVHNCPKNAIHLESEKSSIRFRNEHVTLQDLIEANE